MIEVQGIKVVFYYLQLCQLVRKWMLWLYKADLTKTV